MKTKFEIVIAVEAELRPRRDSGAAELAAELQGLAGRFRDSEECGRLAGWAASQFAEFAERDARERQEAAVTKAPPPMLRRSSS